MQSTALLEHLYIPWLVMLRVFFREAPKRTLTLMISYRDSREKSPSPTLYSYNDIFWCCSRAHAFWNKHRPDCSNANKIHLQVIGIVAGKHNASLTSATLKLGEGKQLKNSLGWTVEQNNITDWHSWTSKIAHLKQMKMMSNKKINISKINLSVETNMFLKKEHPPTKWWTVNSLIENQDPLAKSQKSPSENLRINPQKLVDS